MNASTADIRKLLERTNADYMAAFNSQNAAGVAAQYATGAIVVNSTGPKTDIPAHIEGVFKTGIRRVEVTLDQAWPLGTGTALGMGKFRSAGKDQSGAAIGVKGFWTATYVQEGGKWKIRMLSSFPEALPAK